MDPVSNAILGLVFLGVGAASTFLMFHLWGYPFDHETMRSEAPPRLMRLHRVLGYVYLAVYLYFMTQMIPRLWNYQIEFPARTVAHLTLGMAIGAILIVKLSIVRFFKHLESALIPFLGSALLICTILLIGLSAPFAFREAYLRAATPAGHVLDSENLERVRAHLALAGLEDEAELQRLASPEGLLGGQAVLTEECVRCHDLRTVLARPRTPDNWRQTVQRMAERSTLLAPISEEEQWMVTAYLIAISPELQKSVQERRAQEQAQAESQQAAGQLMATTETAQASVPESYDPAAARKLFDERCSLCHPLALVEAAPPQSKAEVRELVARMVSNGAQGTEQDLAQIVRYLAETYVK